MIGYLLIAINLYSTLISSRIFFARTRSTVTPGDIGVRGFNDDYERQSQKSAETISVEDRAKNRAYTWRKLGKQPISSWRSQNGKYGQVHIGVENKTVTLRLS